MNFFVVAVEPCYVGVSFYKNLPKITTFGLGRKALGATPMPVGEGNAIAINHFRDALLCGGKGEEVELLKGVVVASHAQFLGGMVVEEVG